MSGAYYDLYIKSILDFFGTLVIKSEQTASAINRRLINTRQPVDLNDPTTWKYYLNMSGKYHATDAPMTVISLDTLEEIVFSTEGLERHVATRREYRYGTRYYNELVARFPNQVQLINGILNPVDIDSAIAAENHTIVYWDRSHIESNESDVVEQLQQFITAFFARFDVPDYHMIADLYTATQYGVLFSMLPGQLVNIRLKNCKTDKAHSFHIHSYLSSFGNMRRFLPFMTLQQKLEFYRNIRYLNLNAGFSSSFEWLTEKLMTNRDLPLAEYRLKHNYETLIEDLLPAVEAHRSSINGLAAAAGEDVRTVLQVLEMEVPLAKDNLTVLEQANADTNRVMSVSLSSEVQTKVLESNVVDTAGSERYTLQDVLLNHWIYLAEHGLYNAMIVLTNPTNGEPLQLTAKDAFILYLYAYNLARVGALESLPLIEAKRVKRLPPPSFGDLEMLVDPRIVGSAFIAKAVSDQVEIGEYISIDSFREMCVSVHRVMNEHHFMSRSQGNDYRSVMLEIMTSNFYCDYPIDLGEDILYENWLRERNLDLTGMSRNDLDMFAQDIFNTATGSTDVAETSLRSVQRAMLEMMSAYNSYSIQFVQQINAGGVVNLGKKQVKPQVTSSKSSHLIRTTRRVRLLSWKRRFKHRFTVLKPQITALAAFFKRSRLITVDRTPFYKVVSKKRGGSIHRLGRVSSQLIPEQIVELGDVLADREIEGYLPITPKSPAELFTSTHSDHYTLDESD